jgi:SAM-dependent methyltransferase
MSKPIQRRNQRETNQVLLKQAMLRRLPRRVSAQGEVTLPAVPSLLEHHVQTLHATFAQLGRVFNEEDTARLRKILEKKLEDGFKASAYAKVVVKYQTEEPPSTLLSYNVSLKILTIADEYDRWVNTRQPPLFGAHADSKLLALAHSLGEPKDVPVLDVGAGTGRNTLPLARAGFPTDAIELAPALAKILREEIAKEGLSVRVFEGDALEGELGVPENHYKVVVLAEVIASHIRDVEQCRVLFDGAATALAPGGLLLFSAFLSSDGYKPDPVARELSQVFWCNLFTRADMAKGMEGLPFELVSDESVFEFEKAHLGADAWPPTGWFEEWTNGLDLFDVPLGKAPMELRWLVYRKK